MSKMVGKVCISYLVLQLNDFGVDYFECLWFETRIGRKIHVKMQNLDEDVLFLLDSKFRCIVVECVSIYIRPSLSSKLVFLLLFSWLYF